MLIPENSFIVNLPAWFEQVLKASYSKGEARALARIVMEEVSGREMISILADQEAEWSSAQLAEINRIMIALQANEPLQYILGIADFMDLRFEVVPGVLIPRGETEELVNWLIGDLKKRGAGRGDGLRILDIGCGSGIIGISLAREFPEASVTCVDLYPIPLEITRKNARLNGVDIEVVEMDALNPSPEWLKKSFDVIVSNPPYVTKKQKAQMSANVLDNEPDAALFVKDDDPLIFYRQISEYASKVLNPDACLYFEINEELGNETKSLVNSYFKFVDLKKDIHGKERMIKAYDRF